MTWGLTAVAGATLVGGYLSSSAAGKAASAQAGAASDANAVQLQISRDQLAAQKDALDKQIAAAGATADKQILAQRDMLTQQLGQTEAALAQQKAIYEQTRSDLAPYREAGTAATNQLSTLLGIGGNTGAADYGKYATAEFTPAAFAANQDPGYGFRLSEGLKAVDRQAAARGGLISGNALKASQAYGQDMASQEYQNAFNRYQTVRGNTLSPFQNLSAQGQNAAAMTGNAGAAYGSALGQASGSNVNALGSAGQGISSAYGNAGNATGAAYGNYGQGTTGVLGAYGTNYGNNVTGAANATASGYVGGANAVNQGISNVSNQYYQNQLLNMFANKNTIAGLNNTYGANNVYGVGAANYQPTWNGSSSN
jgi:hypothetical protein